MESQHLSANAHSSWSARRMTRIAGIVVGIVLVAAAPSWAQVAASSVFHGVVRDDTGLPLPGVTVILTSPDLQVGRKDTVTSEEGEYRFGELPGGTYQLQFELAGFR